jgi:alkanesulfonate monooxygenase SsuD/methylene tetrahydromethanopterin reductase-like flavin-dependent oxidoreductase (luciferase family)
MSLIWPGPIDQETYDQYVETWHKHKGDTLRTDGPNSAPRVGCVMVLAIADDEDRALDISKRGMEGLLRRTTGVHKYDKLVLPEDECEAALGPLRHILEHYEDAMRAGAGTPSQITERLGAVLEMGLTDFIIFQIPSGDMTMDEARSTLELFITEVKPQLETIALAA